MARAMGVQSREVWQVVTGSLSAEVESSKTMENPHVSCFAPLLVPYFVAATVYNSSRRSSLCGPLLLCVDIAYTCLCYVCYDTCVFVVIVT